MILLALLFVFLLLLAIGFIIYRLQSKKIRFALSFILIIFSLSLYYFLGNMQGLRNAQLLQQFNESAPNNPNHAEVLQDLVLGLNRQLQQYPDDPITLALLGKIYFTLRDYAQARQVFAKAYALLPDDPELLIDYATADYLAKQGKVDPELSAILGKVKKLPASVESLSLLANVSYESGDSQQAILYWQAMQKQIPKDSELYQELTMMIQWAKFSN